MALDRSPNFVVLRFLGAGRDKAPLPRTVEAGSFFMHDSDNFQWMKPDADVLSLTAFCRCGGEHRPAVHAKEKTQGLG
jgi:hypothetical protein